MVTGFSRSGFLVFVTLGMVLLASVPIYPQVAGATLSGTVTDTSGAVVPQAQISIKNVATGVSTTVTSDTAGFYSAPNLLPGSYEVSASAAGFSTQVLSGVTLTVGAQQVLNLALRVGQVTQTVQVTGEAPTVELASSSISAVVSANTVVELPLNGRDWTQLATLQAGVSAVVTQVPATGVSSRENRGFGAQMTISGTRPQLNNYRLDGISIVDYSGGSPGSIEGVALGVDAVAEFSVITSNYDSEYGRTAGGVINAITRSGTNRFHGDAFEFLRNSALDARNVFDQGGVPPFRRNQFGASLGGPIQKDKTFFFANYEGFRQALGVTNVDKVPSPDARNGIIHNKGGTTCTIGVASPGCTLMNSAGTVGVDPVIQPYLGFYPLPNSGLVGVGNTGLFVIPVNSNTSENFGTVRMDRKFSGKDSLSGTWFYDKGAQDNPDVLDTMITSNFSLRQMIGLEETHSFSSSLVNSLRFGYGRVAIVIEQPGQVFNPLAADLSLGSYPGQAAPNILIPGTLTNFVGSVGGLQGPGSPHTWNSFQVYDDAFLIKGVHSLKFGFAVERMQDNFTGNTRTTSSFTFSSLAAFLENNPLTIFGGVIPGVSPPSDRGVRQSLFGGYIQDDWRWRSNLTLNLGLRYETVTVPYDVQGRLTNLPSFTSTTPRLGSPYFNNPALHNFEPRIGFSWDPFRNGKTAVRGAFGIFDALPLNYNFFVSERSGFPLVTTQEAGSLPPGSFPTKAIAFLGVQPSSLEGESIELNPPRNYIMIWNLNVQRQLTPSTSLMVGYAGNHGVHMLNRADDADVVLPMATPQGLLWPSPLGSGTRLNEGVGDIRALYWAGDSFDAELQAQVRKRMSHGLQVQASYTWGKNIDTGSASVTADPFTNSIGSLYWFCKSCRRGLSDYNIAHNFVLNYLWDVPTPKSWGFIGSQVLGGWELGGIFTAQTGVPITPLIGGDPLGLNSSDPWAFPNRLTGPVCASPVSPNYRTTLQYLNLGCFSVPMAPAAIAAQCAPFSTVPGSCSNLMGNAGRNTVVGPGLVNLDFSLFKNNYVKRISESFNVQFRAEFFNVLNRANFGTPVNNSTLFDQSGAPVDGAGALDQTSTPAREIQFGLKLIW